MTCPATQFITDVEQMAEELMNLALSHHHENGTVWTYFTGIYNHDETRYQWTCRRPDGTLDEYPCTEYGWILARRKPKVAGTKVNGVDANGERYADEWYHCPEYDNESWLYGADEEYTHWMPQSQLPEPKP